VARLKADRPSIAAVMTASAGNHGLGLATAARRLGIRARVHLPRTAPRVKRDRIAELGAELVEADTYDAAEQRAQEERAAGATFISAYSDPDVIAGAGTIALEVLEDQPDIDTFVVPVGGGGLISGVARAAQARRPGARIIAAEAAASPVWRHALAEGRLVTVEVRETVADGLAGNIELDSITFEIVRDLVERMIDVEEASIASAMRELLSREQIRAEGAAAAAVGALLQERDALGLTGRKIAVILSGSNTDQ
jgi:threonine dehydratase